MSIPLTAWIGVDWGTSHMRAWAFDNDNHVIAQAASPRGMASLAPAEPDDPRKPERNPSPTNPFEQALMSLVSGWLPPTQTTPVVTCGMVGARQGWQEAPYVKTPCTPPILNQSIGVVSADSRLSVHILPGVAQDSPPEVMRGEETQIGGLLAKEPDFTGLVCLPGTHSKWVRIQPGGTITSLATYMTGELFRLLHHHSLLRFSTSKDGENAEAFAQGVHDGYSDSPDLTRLLFGIRAQQLLDDNPPNVASLSRLSGLLVGAELASGLRSRTDTKQIVIIGKLAPLYRQAFQEIGVATREVDSRTATCDGLIRVWRT
ncbi:MAG: 2-dehydro-3-deoxygalactonokinase [Pseudomonadota bacterium]